MEAPAQEKFTSQISHLHTSYFYSIICLFPHFCPLNSHQLVLRNYLFLFSLSFYCCCSLLPFITEVFIVVVVTVVKLSLEESSKSAFISRSRPLDCNIKCMLHALSPRPGLASNQQLLIRSLFSCRAPSLAGSDTL